MDRAVLGDAVEFALLGPVGVRADGRRIKVGHARQQCVLVTLLVDVNQEVPVDALIDRVWGENPPARARDSLYSYLSRLRLALADTDEVVIERRPGGYLLTADASTVDMHRFRTLVGQARSTDDDQHGAALFEQALGLWRGAAFAGLDTSWLNRTRTELEAERRAAQLDHTDLELRLGRHGRLLAGLEVRAKEHPLDERLAGQFMLALYRDGRQSDALQVFQHTRNALVEELGVEPGAELRQLHGRVLATDLELVIPTPESRTVAPRQLPADTGHFTGRGDQLTRLLALCPEDRDGAPPGTVVISAVGGMAGVGKTTLAVHAAHRLAGRFDDGTLFMDLRGFTPGADPVMPEQALDCLLRGLGVPGAQIPPDLDTRAALYRTVLARRRVLIVLDNAADETQLQPLLPSAPGCWVVVTSRRHLAGLDDAVHLSLPVLPAPEAAALFGALAAERATPADARVVEEIVALCGHLPLAIRIAAARLRSSPATTPARLLAELSEVVGAGQGLDWLSDGHRAVTAALGVSYGHLTPDQQHAFRLLGLHPGVDIEPYALAALADTTLDHARRLLDQLHAVSLVDQTNYRRYTLHDLVAAYAATLAHEETEEDQRAALGRLFGHYAYTASVAMGLAYPWETAHPWESDERPRTPATGTPTPVLADSGQSQRWLDTELNNLLAAAHQAPHLGWPDHTSHQATVVHRHLRTRGRYTDSQALHDLALQHTRRTGDRVGEHNALLGLAGVHLWLGRYDQAVGYCGQSLVIAREIGNRTGEQLALHCRGDIHKMRNQFGPATDHLERALTIVRETGNRIAEQDILHCLAGIHRSLGHFDQAVICCRESLAIARETGNRTGEQLALQRRGDIHWLQGHHEPAADLYRQVVALAREANNLIREQFALCGLGNAHQGLGRHEAAADYFQQALAIARRTGDRVCQFEVHQGLGRVHHATGHHREALDHHHTALELATELGHPADQARAHDGLAHGHHTLGDTTRGRHHWHAALDILTDLDLDHADEPDVTTVAIRTRLAKGSAPEPPTPSLQASTSQSSKTCCTPDSSIETTMDDQNDHRRLVRNHKTAGQR